MEILVSAKLWKLQLLVMEIDSLVAVVDDIGINSLLINYLIINSLGIQVIYIIDNNLCLLCIYNE